MGKLFSKLNNRRNDNNSSANNDASTNESKEDEQKSQTLAEKADSMQEVMKNIYMGSYAAAKSKELLETHGITHILAIGWDLKAHFPDDFEYCIFSKVEDNPSYFLLQHFDEAFKFMDSCLRPQTVENNNNNNNNNTNNSDNNNNNNTSNDNTQSNNDGTSNNSNNNNNNNNNSENNSSNNNDTNTNTNTNTNNNNNNSKGNNKPGKILVHCHKGLSRSASIIMGYEMSRQNKTFTQVLNEIRESRSFIMPNIGFQAQLQVFEEKKYSLNMSDYDNLDVLSRISEIIPSMYDSIVKYAGYYESGKDDLVDGQDLFGLTMYFHQLFMLHREKDLCEKDIKLLNLAIEQLYKIQKDYIQIESSITRFEKLFKLGKYNKPSKKDIAREKKRAELKAQLENENKENKENNGDNQDTTGEATGVAAAAAASDEVNDDNNNNEEKETFSKKEEKENDASGTHKTPTLRTTPEMHATAAAETAMVAALDAATQASEAEDDDNGNNDNNNDNNDSTGAAAAAGNDNNGKENDGNSGNDGDMANENNEKRDNNDNNNDNEDDTTKQTGME